MLHAPLLLLPRSLSLSRWHWSWVLLWVLPCLRQMVVALRPSPLFRATTPLYRASCKSKPSFLAGAAVSHFKIEPPYLRPAPFPCGRVVQPSSSNGFASISSPPAGAALDHAGQCLGPLDFPGAALPAGSSACASSARAVVVALRVVVAARVLRALVVAQVASRFVFAVDLAAGAALPSGASPSLCPCHHAPAALWRGGRC